MKASNAFEGCLKYADFGANIGVTSYFAAAHGTQTLAVDAERNNFAILEEGKRVNAFGPEFNPVFMAASGKEGMLHLSENSAWGVISKEKEGTYAVQCDTIAHILKNRGFSDAQIIKVDIEGAELSAMTGFEDIISGGRTPDIIMESNEPACERNDYTCQDLWSRMFVLGYDVFQHRGLSLTPAAAQDAQVADILATRRTPYDLEQSLGYKIVPYSAETATSRLNYLLSKAPDKSGVREFVARQMAHMAKS